MPGPVSESSKGPSDSSPYVPSWCFEPPGPRMCICGHHEGYHGDDGHCNQQLYGTCKCTGLRVAVSEPGKHADQA